MWVWIKPGIANYMTRSILYEDEAGNKLIRDHDGRLAVINRQGRFVNDVGFKKIARKAGIRFESKGKSRKGPGGVRITGVNISADENHPIWERLDERKKSNDIFSMDNDWGLGI